MMFKPIFIFLGTISMTLAQDYFHSNYFDRKSNNFGGELAKNPERSMDLNNSLRSNPCNGEPSCCTVENPCDVNEGSCRPGTCKEGLFCENDK